jgi:hypothetical protein
VTRALLVLAVCGALAARAEDECAADASLASPQFVAKLPKGFRLLSTKKESRHITQLLKVPGGFTVKLTLGGCAHVGFTLSVSGAALTMQSTPAEVVAVASKVLPTLPLIVDATVDPKIFLDALAATKVDALPAKLPCGDATCRLVLEAPGVAVLSYDFAL